AVPVGPLARTGSGRWQFFTVPSGQPSRILWGPSSRHAVRWHSRGGFAVAPPSRHPGGAVAQWVRPLATPLPDQRPLVHELLAARNAHGAA
ncbi:MAG TPA: bifunctional DNA primase/polymerase, partial [Actinomycetota bacterium]|nr:bifunctional DNA primase/polymerase [Actinomycetota bacterium]